MRQVSRDQLKSLMGGLEPAHFHADPLPDTPGLHGLVFTSASGESVRAVFGLPDGDGPHPAVLYCHAHGNRYDIGIDELMEGRPALTAPFADDLLTQGIAFLAIEMPCFGTRQTETESAAAKRHLWRGTTLFGQMLVEQIAALNLLESSRKIDPNCIGTLGISMGGTLAWWLGAMDPRVRCVVSMCCFADLNMLIDTGAHDGHGIYMMVPGLSKLARTGQIAGLATQAAQLHCVGLLDWSTPEDAFHRARLDLVEACQKSAAPMPKFYIDPQLNHSETPQMRAEVLAFLATTLSP